MLKAAVDIGSNSVRLLVGSVEKGRVQVAEQHLRTTRLGKTAKGGSLNKDAVARTIGALAEFKEILAKFGLQNSPVVAATSAVREAADKAEFAALIEKELGWRLQILDGEEEAALSYLGASSVVSEPAAVIDVGGGSTELIFAKDGKIVGRSVPVGAVRLHLGEVAAEDLAHSLQPLADLYAARQGGLVFVGVGGTITSLAAMKLGLKEYCREKINGVVITAAELAAYYEELQKMTAANILAKYPLLQNREDIICHGIAVYLTLAQLLPMAQIVVSDAGILDGLLLQDNGKR